MNEAVAKKTQDTLGKVIKKPPLTEKLLSKPPFRYLHDIFSEVIRTTGFMKGLYTEAELKSDNVKDKDAKIAFLQKAIDVVTLVSGESLAVKPARVVAGHEPERTNELLQAIGRCCLSKLSSEDAVRRVLAGERPDLRGKSQDKENREGREPPRGKEERREIRDRSSSRDRKDSEQPREEGRRTERDRHREGERSDKGRERTKDREREKDKSRDRDKAKERESQKDGEKRRDREKDRDRDREKDRDRDKDRDKERDKDRDRERDRDRDREKDRDRDREMDRDRERQRHKDTEEKNKEEKADRKSRHPEESHNRPPPEQPSKTKKNEPEEAESPSRIPRPSSAKGQRRWPKAGHDESDSEGEADSPSAEKPPAPLENGDVKDSVPPPPPRAGADNGLFSSSSRRISRPSSARPAPPRVRKQESHSEAPPVDRLGSAKPSSAVIVEGKQLSDDEDGDAQFVVEDAAAPPADRPAEMDHAVELQGDEKHGGLVKKILETKKDYETSPSSPKSKEKGTPVSEAAHRKERDLVSREMERLRSSIQTVCRSALPLGKIMDYIQEDMDSMQNELQAWRRENQEQAHALLQEQRVTDSAVEPLKAELAELEQLIKDQQDKICAVKCNILRNEEKIQKMLSSINFSSRT
ncbi:hypothetical protein MATL_G00146110 [Megalops atlanticus]|uniref:TRAF3-interacting protein 1 n=1 Tax=Megalops atlanticus TaxID=7932 RepID=A0A9D3PS46_MEGAT|nr:hypothetical protein MATL_G00146110 [Megalops atlanticus]